MDILRHTGCLRQIRRAFWVRKSRSWLGGTPLVSHVLGLIVQGGLGVNESISLIIRLFRRLI